MLGAYNILIYFFISYSFTSYCETISCNWTSGIPIDFLQNWLKTTIQFLHFSLLFIHL